MNENELFIAELIRKKCFKLLKTVNYNNLRQTFIERHIHLEHWDFHKLSYQVTLNFAKKYPDKNWNLKYCRTDDCKTVEELETEISNGKINYDLSDYFNSHKIDFSLEFIELHKDEINWNGISYKPNPNLTEEFIERYIDKDWDFQKLTKIVSLNFIDRFSDKNWDFHYNISSRIDNIAFLERYINRFWNWEILQKRLNIDWLDFIERHIDDKLNFFSLSYRDDIIPLVEKYPEKSWYWPTISKNPNLTPEFLEKNFEREWSEEGWKQLSKHPNINMEFIERHQEQPWKWEYILLKNPNVTVEFVERYFNDNYLNSKFSSHIIMYDFKIKYRFEDYNEFKHYKNYSEIPVVKRHLIMNTLPFIEDINRLILEYCF